MKTSPSFRSENGYALMMVLFFGGISLLALTGALKWASSTAENTDRNNKYFAAVSAAEAATEKVLSTISRDFQGSGEKLVYDSMGAYASLVPLKAENSYWGDFTFSDAQGNVNYTYVDRLSSWGYVPLESQYEGLWGMAAKYRIISNAKVNKVSPALAVGLKQEIQVASIPIFQFAIFYTMDLEINPGPPMNVTGRVHSNGMIYNQPQATLNYQSHVTAAGTISMGKSPKDPTVRTLGTVNFWGEHDSGVNSLTLPIGTNNTPDAVRAVIEVPPPTEPPNSLIGQQRYHNKADIIILVSNVLGVTTVTVKSGAWNSFASAIPYDQVKPWVNTDVSFFNKRELKTIKATQIDIVGLREWSRTNTIIRPTLGRDVNAVYVADQRTQAADTESGVRLINGQQLPPNGLTVATMNPAYILGHYNAPPADLGTSNTLATMPASVVADAITILSTAWKDTNSAMGIGSRKAASTTINAAFLAGIVQSNGFNYSGGVENFPRFLEDWSDDVFTYNGSMVVMFPSKIATKPWGTADVYSPPSRNWAFDLNFMDARRLPPGTPQVLTTIRAKWAMLNANTIE